MDKDGKWVIIRIDDKIASISTDYRAMLAIAGELSRQKNPEYAEITVRTASFEEVWNLRGQVSWEDFLLFGTAFQKKVWKCLYDLLHEFPTKDEEALKLLSYSDFADRCGCLSGVRAVAHAVGLNPLAVLIPCHLIVPKEAIDRIDTIRTKAQSTIFKGEDICIDKILSDPSIDLGEYALGRPLKRELIRLEHQLSE
ncbi:MAG: methylated-DNA--[protein]-cysteine S-methyltransferase [Candidatus Cryptobacteroides sp.]